VTISRPRNRTTLILALAAQSFLISACSSTAVPYQTYDNSLNRAVASCLNNQSAITGFEAAGATLAMAAGGQGLGTLGLEGEARLTLTITSAVSGLLAAGMTSVALGIHARMKLKSCEAIMDRHRRRMDFEIELKKQGGPEPLWWPAAQETYDRPVKPARRAPNLPSPAAPPDR